MSRAGTVVDSSVLLDVVTEDPRWIDAATGRPLQTRDPRRVATYIPGAELIAPG